MFAAVDSVPEGHENKTLLHQCADELGLPPGKVNGEVVWDDQKVKSEHSPKFISGMIRAVNSVIVYTREAGGNRPLFGLSMRVHLREKSDEIVSPQAFEMLHAKHLAKAQAFSMGMHSRLGAKSQVLQLVAATDCFGVIMREFWGTSYLG